MRWLRYVSLSVVVVLVDQGISESILDWGAQQLHQLIGNHLASALGSPSIAATEGLPDRPGDIGGAQLGLITDQANHYVHQVSLSYCNDSVLAQYHRAPSRPLVFIEGVTEPELQSRFIVLVDQVRRELIVSFRGTSSIATFLEDLRSDLVPNPWGAGKLHHGTLNIALRLFKLARSTGLAKALAVHPQYRVVVTGHSLGGALASLAAVVLHREYRVPYSRINVITYGQPRLSDHAFVSWYHQLGLSSYLRVTNGDDPITHFPPKELGYRHMNNELWFAPQKFSKFCYSGEDNRCSQSKTKDLKIADHNFIFDRMINSGRCY